jgi:pSer/pThr/pTyr-binding forkhead associated (FHA) protein
LKQLRYLNSSASLRGEESVIGRSDYCSILIAHPSVSRLHASISRTPDGLQIRDLGSRNGTFVNGVAVGATPVLVNAGDAVRIGTVECRIENSEDTGQETADGTDPELWDATSPIQSPRQTGNHDSGHD